MIMIDLKNINRETSYMNKIKKIFVYTIIVIGVLMMYYRISFELGMASMFIGIYLLNKFVRTQNEKRN